jgi:hypothetical protein
MPRPAKSKPNLPFPFLLEALAPLKPEVRRLFSGQAVYANDRLLVMVRDNVKSPEDNGLWLVLAEGIDPADPTLRRDFPSIRTIKLLRSTINHWLLIPSDAPDFESSALHACDLILRHDPRIGRIPHSRR